MSDPSDVMKHTNPLTDPALFFIIRDLRLGHASPAACADRLERLIPYDGWRAAAEQYGEQLEAVGDELDRFKREVRLVGKNREHAERLEDILEGERS